VSLIHTRFYREDDDDDDDLTRLQTSDIKPARLVIGSDWRKTHKNKWRWPDDHKTKKGQVEIIEHWFRRRPS